MHSSVGLISYFVSLVLESNWGLFFPDPPFPRAAAHRRLREGVGPPVRADGRHQDRRHGLGQCRIRTFRGSLFCRLIRKRVRLLMG